MNFKFEKCFIINLGILFKHACDYFHFWERVVYLRFYNWSNNTCVYIKEQLSENADYTILTNNYLFCLIFNYLYYSTLVEQRPERLHKIITFCSNYLTHFINYVLFLSCILKRKKNNWNWKTDFINHIISLFIHN